MFMPALVNYGGGDELLFMRGMELSRFHSIDSLVDVYRHSSRKRACIYAPGSLGECLEGPEKRISLEVLPDGCLLEIFGWLAGGRKRGSCGCVSKCWLFLLSSMHESDFGKNLAAFKEDKQSVGDGYLSRCLEGKKATDVRLAAIAVGTSRGGGLGKLSIRGNNPVRGITNFGLSAIFRCCPSLQNLCDCPNVSNKGLIAIAEHCPVLTSLSIESCPRIGNEGLGTIGRLCPSLQTISIKDCSLVGDTGITSLVTARYSILNRIKLQSLNITDLSLAVIGRYSLLVSNLVLGSLKNTSEKGFWVMGDTQGLKRVSSMTIVSSRGITDFSLEAIGKSCVSSKQMYLRRCCFVSDEGLADLARNAASLEIAAG